MYKFHRRDVGGFTLHTSRPDVGDEHHKRFGAGVTPANQWTLNIYTAGRFEIEIPSIGYRREMFAGDCSLDIELQALPPDLCIERCLDEGSSRICIAPATRGARWARRVIDLAEGSSFVAPLDHVLVVMSGVIEADGQHIPAGEYAQLGDGVVLRSDSAARGMLMILL